MTENELKKTIAIYKKTLEVTADNGETCFRELDKNTLLFLEELEQYRAIGTVEEIQQKLAELDRWHTSEVNQLAEEYNNESVKGDLISRSALIEVIVREAGKCMKDGFLSLTNAEETGLCDIIRNQPTACNDGWIPCSERLPEENQNVIACFISGSVCILDFYNGFFHGMYDYSTKVIIAWQPLPPAFKPKG